MPMMVCSSEDFNLEVERLTVDYKTLELGRKPNTKAVPNEVRALIAAEAIAGISVDEIKEKYNVSASSISAYKVGATSTSSYNQPDEKLDNSNKRVRAGLSERAEEVALEAIGLLTVEKLESVKARDLAAITKDMSSVMVNMRESNGNSGPKVNITIMVPQIADEQDFKVIDVGE